MKENVTALQTTENIYGINVKTPLAIVHKYKEKLNMSTQIRMELKVIKLKIGLEWESISLQNKRSKQTKNPSIQNKVPSRQRTLVLQSVVECFPSTPEALGTTPSIAENQQT